MANSGSKGISLTPGLLPGLRRAGLRGVRGRHPQRLAPDCADALRVEEAVPGWNLGTGTAVGSGGSRATHCNCPKRYYISANLAHIEDGAAH